MLANAPVHRPAQSKSHVSEIHVSGHFEGKVHILPVRIYYEDTDLSGVVYHANYLRYMERGRSEFFRSVGIVRLAQLDAPEPTAWALRKAEIEYVRPARLDDLIEVHTQAMSLSGARLAAEQDIFCKGVLLTRGRVEACMMTLDGKPRRIPPDTREKFAPYLNERND
jgi:acyl-CoA thioester hydrolase